MADNDMGDIFGDSDSDGEDFQGLKKDDVNIPETAANAIRAEDVDSLSEEDVAVKTFKIPKKKRTASESGDKKERKRSKKSEKRKQRTKSASQIDEDGNPISGAESDGGSIKSDNEEEGKPQKELSDFDKMLKRRQAMSRRRKSDKLDLDDMDDLISELIDKMSEAASLDRIANEAGKPAFSKLKMLKNVAKQLRKKDLQANFLDQGVLAAIREWLEPLPDGALTHISIRTAMLEILFSMPIDKQMLKDSGVGRMVMLLYKHPKETDANKKLTKRIIDQWSRPIFGLHSSYREVGEENDYREIDVGHMKEQSLERIREREAQEAENKEKDLNFHARVPQASDRDYKIRPKSKINAADLEVNSGKNSKLDTISRKYKEKRMMNAKTKQHAMKMSIEGRKVKN
eukprot:Nk52_evm9s1992 gene=Nk52_evmTU9s1992